MANDIAELNLGSIGNQMETQLGEVAKRREQAVKALDIGLAQQQSLDNTYTNTINLISNDVQSSMDEMVAAQERLAEIRGNSPVINTIMTILGNEDYNARAQEERVAAARTRAARASTRLDTAQTQYTVQTNLIKGRVAAETGAMEMAAGAFDDLSQALNAKIALESNRRTNEAEVLAEMSDQQIELALKDPKKIPEGLSASRLQEESIRRGDARLRLRQMEQAVTAGDIELQTKIMEDLGKSLPVNTIDAALSAAESTGEAQLPGSNLLFTVAELRSLKNYAAQRDLQLTSAEASASIAAEAYRGVLTEVAHTANILSSDTGLVFDPNNPTAALAPKVQVQVESLIGQLDAAKKTNSVADVSRISGEIKTILDTAKADIIDRTPENSKNARKEYLDNGYISDPKSAEMALLDIASNPNADAGIYQDLFPKISNELSRIQSETGRLTMVPYGPNAQIPMPAKALPAEALSARLAEKVVDVYVDPVSGAETPITFRQAAINNHAQMYLGFAIMNMAQATGDKELLELVDPQTGEPAAQFYSYNERGAKNFSETKFLNRLVEISGGTDQAMELFGRLTSRPMLDGYTQYRKLNPSGFNEAVLDMWLTGNNYGPALSLIFNQYRQHIPQAVIETQVTNEMNVRRSVYEQERNLAMQGGLGIQQLVKGRGPINPVLEGK